MRLPVERHERKLPLRRLWRERRKESDARSNVVWGMVVACLKVLGGRFIQTHLTKV